MAADTKNWREIAEQAANEQDPQKLLELTSQLSRVLDEEQTSKAPQIRKENHSSK